MAPHRIARTHYPQKSAGFSLLEVLVAFSILAMSLGVLLQIFSSSLRNVGISGDYALATELAESVLARAGSEIALDPGEHAGTHGEKFRWQLAITPFVDETSGPPVIRPATPPLRLMQVRVNVRWGDEPDARAVVLDTLRVTPENLQK